MKAELQKQLEDLKIAYSKNLLTTNEYCELYHAIGKKIKSLN